MPTCSASLPTATHLLTEMWFIELYPDILVFTVVHARSLPGAFLHLLLA